MTKAGTPVLAFDGVRFQYPGAREPVLDDVSFQIARGQTLALVGRSGCGKSTAAALAARLLDPAAGAIRLHGLPLTDYSEADFRKKVTVLSQRPYLFNETIAANLRVADPGASDARLWEALDMAALAERIREGVEGLDTLLGEGGLGLSGGEQRRLGLARAYLTDPDLFILDEMTEGLDADTARDVLRRFASFRKDAAVLMIAHKPQEIEFADEILSLRDVSSSLAAE